MNETLSLFTELTPSEEASLSGGKKDAKTAKLPKTLVIIGEISGAGGGAGSGGATTGGSSGAATGGSGVVIVVK